MLSRRWRWPRNVTRDGPHECQWNRWQSITSCLIRKDGEQLDETPQLPSRTALDGAKDPNSDDATTPSLTVGMGQGRQTRSRHLLRAILRECTYLPDAFSRRWLTQHALTRFRSYDFRSWKHRNDTEYEPRLRAKEKEARSWVTYLKRANHGERKCLMRVLFMAYGRIGKRRHELLMPLMEKKDHQKIAKMLSEQRNENEALDVNNEHDPNLLEQVRGPTADTDQKKYGQPDKLDKTSTLKIEPELTPQLRALLVSQIQHSPPSIVRTHLRRITREVPALNAWLRPMPQVRVRNMRKKHLLELLDRALPPLPTQDWKRLLDLASGREAIQSPGTRRTLAKTSSHAETNIGASLGDNAALETVLAYGKPPTKVLLRYSGHAITPRYMRRLYTQVLSQCSYMEWDNESKKWSVTWGDKQLQQQAISRS